MERLSLQSLLSAFRLASAAATGHQRGPRQRQTGSSPILPAPLDPSLICRSVSPSRFTKALPKGRRITSSQLGVREEYEAQRGRASCPESHRKHMTRLSSPNPELSLLQPFLSPTPNIPGHPTEAGAPSSSMQCLFHIFLQANQPSALTSPLSSYLRAQPSAQLIN